MQPSMSRAEALHQLRFVPVTDLEALAYMEAHAVLGLRYPSTREERARVLAGGGVVSETLQEALRLLLESREQKGVETYGETLDTSRVDMQVSLVEEMADAVMYSARLVRELRSLVRSMHAVVEAAEAAEKYWFKDDGHYDIVSPEWLAYVADRKKAKQKLEAALQAYRRESGGK